MCLVQKMPRASQPISMSTEQLKTETYRPSTGVTWSPHCWRTDRELQLQPLESHSHGLAGLANCSAHRPTDRPTNQCSLTSSDKSSSILRRNTVTLVKLAGGVVTNERLCSPHYTHQKSLNSCSSRQTTLPPCWPGRLASTPRRAVHTERHAGAWGWRSVILIKYKNYTSIDPKQLQHDSLGQYQSKTISWYALLPPPRANCVINDFLSASTSLIVRP